MTWEWLQKMQKDKKSQFHFTFVEKFGYSGISTILLEVKEIKEFYGTTG